MTDLQVADIPVLDRRTSPAASRTSARWTLALVCVAVFMLLLDVTIVIVALPAISTDLHASLDRLQWVIDAYTLPLAGLLLTAATLGDRIGRRRVFLAGLSLFTLGSLGCALAPTSLTLDVTRVSAGCGGALLFGTALPLLGAAFPDARRRAGAIGVFGATLAAATAVGPLLGGALVAGPGWRWIFLLNVPIGLVSLPVAFRKLAESRADTPRRADWPGTALLVGGLLALLFALIRGNSDGWGSGLVVALLVVSGLLLVGFVFRQARAASPMLDLGLFARRSFVGVGLSAFAISATLIASTTYLALYVQNALGFSPWNAGLRFLPLTVVSFVAAPVAARLTHRVSPRIMIGLSMALVAVGMLLETGLTGSSSWTHLLPGFVLSGAGMGISSAALTAGALSAVEPARAGMATGVVNTLRQVGVAVGVAVLGAIFQSRTQSSTGHRLAGTPLSHHSGTILDAVGSGAGTLVARSAPAAVRGQLADIARAATASGLDLVLLVGGVGAAIATVVAFVLIRRS